MKWMRMLPLLLVLTACSTQRKAFLFPDQNTSLAFGRGGGVTGAVEEYIIDTSGKVFSHKTLTRETDYTEVKTLTRQQLDDIADKLENLDFQKTTFSHPGNLYWFIETRNEVAPHRIAWGDPDVAAPPEMVDLYQYLEKLVAVAEQ